MVSVKRFYAKMPKKEKWAARFGLLSLKNKQRLTIKERQALVRLARNEKVKK